MHKECMCVHIHAPAHTHTPDYMHTYPLTHDLLAHTLTHIHTHSHTHAHTHSYTHAHTRSHTPAYTHAHTSARAHVHMLPNTRTDSQTHTRTHLLTNACRSHTHMHTPTLTHCRHLDQGRKQSLLEECHRHSQSGLFLPLSTVWTRVTERRARKVTSSAHAPWGWRVSIQPTQPSAGPFDRERGGYRSSRHRPAGSAATMLP